MELPDSSRRPDWRGVNGGVNVIFSTSIHTFIHTTFTGSARRPWKPNRRAELALEISETGGLVVSRSGGRAQRCAARTRSSRKRRKHAKPKNGEDRHHRTRFTPGQVCPPPRIGGDEESYRLWGSRSKWRRMVSKSSKVTPRFGGWNAEEGLSKVIM